MVANFRVIGASGMYKALPKHANQKQNGLIDMKIDETFYLNSLVIRKVARLFNTVSVRRRWVHARHLPGPTVQIYSVEIGNKC